MSKRGYGIAVNGVLLSLPVQIPSIRRIKRTSASAENIAEHLQLYHKADRSFYFQILHAGFKR